MQPILAGLRARASDFINKARANATPALDEGRVPVLEATGKLHRSFLPVAFGGDGSDGNLIITSGVTTIDLGGLEYAERNYAVVSITGSASLAFSNPHVNGTIFALKSQNDVIVTSSANPAINMAGMGASAGLPPTGRWASGDEGLAGGAGGQSAGGTAGAQAVVRVYTFTEAIIRIRKNYLIMCGAGGAEGGQNGDASGGANRFGTNGGRGGGGLVIECGGSWNVTANISVAGISAINNTNIVRAGTAGPGAGGGGAAGMFLGFYNNLIANTGAIVATGGNGGHGAAGSGTTGSWGGGGGGAGSLVNVGAAGGAINAAVGLNAAAASGAGGGGGAGFDGTGAGGLGGLGGSSMGGIVMKNTMWT